MGASEQSKRDARRLVSFRAWLLDISPGGGLRRLFTRHLIFHAAIGACFAATFSGDLCDRARSVVLPLAGVLVGLTFAWAATAMTIVTSKEFRRIMLGSKQGVRGTANYFQLAIFVVLTATISWAVVGLGPYSTIPGLTADRANLCVAFCMFSLTSLAVRECWGAINLTRLSLLAFSVASEGQESKTSPELEEARARDAGDEHLTSPRKQLKQPKELES